MSCRRRLARAAVPAGAALLLLAWVAQAQQEPLTATPFTQPEFVEADCSKWFGRPGGVHIDCGYVSVLEDRAKPHGNVIRLAVARLRGSVPSPHPDPVIYLAGGPGESALGRTYWLIDDARFIWEERDLILLDQRGVGHSEPRLECPDYHRQKAVLRELDLDPDDELQREVDALLAFLLHRLAGGDHRVAWVFYRYRFVRGSIDNSAAWASLLCHADGRFADRPGELADRAAHPRMADPEAPDLVPVLCAAWHDPTDEPIDKPRSQATSPPSCCPVSSIRPHPRGGPIWRRKR